MSRPRRTALCLCLAAGTSCQPLLPCKFLCIPVQRLCLCQQTIFSLL